MPGDLDTLEQLLTFTQSLTNRSLLVAVARELKLNEDVRLFPSQFPAPTDADLAKAITPLVQAELRRGTRLVDISAKYFDAETARKIADTVIALYIRLGASNDSTASQQGTDYLRSEAARLQAKLAESDRTLQEFKERNLGLPVEGGSNVGLDRLKEMNAQLTVAKGQRLKLEAEMAQLQAMSAGDPSALQQVASLASLPEVVSLQSLVAAKDVEFSVLRQRYMFKHPKYITAQRELADLIKARDAALQTAAGRVRMSFDNAVAAEQKLQQAITEQEKLAMNLSKLSTPLTQLQNEVAADRELYESVSKRLKELTVASGVALTNFRISEAPMVEPDAISPKKKQVLAIAMALGLMMGFGSALAHELVKPSAKSVAEGREMLGAPVLAELPGGNTSDLLESLHAASLIGSAQHEGFRELRASLRKLRPDREPRSVAVTSTEGTAGKSQCALNLAAAFAQDGLRTLLVEVDFTEPMLAETLLESHELPALGLTDGLTGSLSPTAFCHHTSVPNLYLIPAGHKLQGAQGLLSRPAFQNLMLLAWNSFDRIVLEAPMVSDMIEPLAPVRFAEAVCLVVPQGQKTKKDLTPALNKLRFPGHAPTGLVVCHQPGDLDHPLGHRSGFSLHQLLGNAEAA
jgi:polysaccharide biosynthesis transport protein